MAISLDTLSASLHSVKISDGTNDMLIDGSGHLSINDGGNVISIDDAGGSLTVDGTVAATQSGTWNIATLTGITNDVNIADGGNSITVDSADLTTIAGAVSGTEMQVDVITMPTVTVTATSLDIRALTHATDSIKIGDGTEFLAINADGSINVSSAPAGLDSWQTSVLSATTTAGEIAATPLANRIRMVVQNLGSQNMYLGEDNTVTTSTGIMIPKGSSFEFPYGATANLWAITAAGTADLRIAEYAD